LAVLLLFVVIVGGVLSLKTNSVSEPSAVSGLPHTDQSWIVSQRQAQLPASAIEPAIVVFYRTNHQRLTNKEVSAIRALSNVVSHAVALAAPTSNSYPLGPVSVSRDGRVAILSIAISSAPNDNAVSTRVLALRAALQSHRIQNIDTAVTGAPGFTTDLGRVFNGADTTLLLATVLVVALLLIATYRSPVLWLIPLLVVGMADQVAATLAAHLAPHVGIRLDGASTGIAQVIVFGAGTDYGLLLIARYRDLLRRETNRFVAMREAVRRTSESIFASATTVTLALACLLSASLMGTRALGFAAGIGIVIAALFVALVLPAALIVCGRGLFWPLIPRFGDESHRDGKLFGGVGDFVSRRPRFILTVAVVLLVLFAALGLGTRTGLSATQQFTATPESVVGQQILETAFPAGSSDPIIVVAPTATVSLARNIAQATPGVTAISTGPADHQWTQLNLATGAAPSSQASFKLVTQLRSRLAAVSQVAVGGDSAISLDQATATSHDTRYLAPLILLIVVLVLIGLLRSLVAPLLLLLTVIASYFAAMGVAWFIFQHGYHFPALNTGTNFYAFLFLVALGVDYNIFLTARAREERGKVGTREGMLLALRSTGGVITSAGILLASVFLVLGVLPLIALTQIGVIVCAGVLLDTLLVRTVVVPAIALTLGDRFWWPAKDEVARPIQ
jgi:RND superfamily putative drug exporter